MRLYYGWALDSNRFLCFFQFRRFFSRELKSYRRRHRAFIRHSVTLLCLLILRLIKSLIYSVTRTCTHTQYVDYYEPDTWIPIGKRSFKRIRFSLGDSQGVPVEFASNTPGPYPSVLHANLPWSEWETRKTLARRSKTFFRRSKMIP